MQLWVKFGKVCVEYLGAPNEHRSVFGRGLGVCRSVEGLGSAHDEGEQSVRVVLDVPRVEDILQGVVCI
jgi:hypothetical protein